MSITQTLEAEQAVLGALLAGGALEICPLTSAHFYDGLHARIFEKIQERMAAGERADGMALRQWAGADPEMKKLGGVDYLLTLIQHGACLESQIQAHAIFVRDAAHQRAARASFAGALSRLDRGDDLFEVIAESEDALRDLGRESDAEAADLADAAEGFLLTMDRRALSTGLEELDEQIGGLFDGELIILAGRPSMGKTSLAAVIARAGAANGRVTHFASLEMPKEQLAARAISAASYRREYGTERVQYYALRNGTNIDRRLLAELAAELPRTLAIDDRPAQTVAQLERAARATRRKYKRLDLIVVDYLQLMTSKRSDGRVNEVTEISQGLKALAKRLGVPVLALSQLSRGVESRDNKRPTLADLRDSGAIEQDADVVIGCYRPAYYLERAEPDASDADGWAKWSLALKRCRNEFEAIVLKQRAGPIGTVKLVCHLEFDTIVDRRGAA